jgi:hypothetical protein
MKLVMPPSPRVKAMAARSIAFRTFSEPETSVPGVGERGQPRRTPGTRRRGLKVESPELIAFSFGDLFSVISEPSVAQRNCQRNHTVFELGFHRAGNVSARSGRERVTTERTENTEKKKTGK